MRAKLCLSLGSKTLRGLEEKVGGCGDHQPDLVEVRIDYLERFDLETLDRILKPYRDRLILTCRPPREGGDFRGSEEERVKTLESLLDLRPGMVDIEIKTLEENPHLASRARSLGVKVIASWHSFDGTPPRETLLERVEEGFKWGDMVKIVTMAQGIEDNLEVLELYRGVEEGRLIAFCMGWEGLISRILSLQLGAPFTYVSLPSEATAPGQISIDVMRRILDVLG